MAPPEMSLISDSNMPFTPAPLRIRLLQLAHVIENQVFLRNDFQLELAIILQTHYEFKEWYDLIPGKWETSTVNARFVKLSEYFFLSHTHIEQAGILIAHSIYTLQIIQNGLSAWTWPFYYFYKKRALEAEAMAREQSFLQGYIKGNFYED